MSTTEKPGLYAALSAQKKQALLELINHTDPETIVTIEKDDDVAVCQRKSVELIQVKSVTSSSGNPLSNSSSDLWKTLHNWVLKLANNDGNYVFEHFRYSVSSFKKINPGKISKLFFNAKGEHEAENAYSQAATLTERYSDNRHRALFFAPENKQFAIEIITGFSYEVHINFEEEIKRTFLNSNAFPDEWVNSLLDTMAGWIDRSTAPDVEKGQPAQMRREDFRAYLTAESNRLRVAPLLEDAPLPSPASVNEEIASNPIYVKQLGIIGLKEKGCMDAIIDFLRSRTLIEKWSEELNVTSIEIRAYQSRIVNDWHDIRTTEIIDRGDLGDEAIGQKIYSRSRMSSRCLRMHNSDLPGYVAHGQLHDLANDLRIGWHPDYLHILSNEGEY